jgi:hypothetical protein
MSAWEYMGRRSIGKNLVVRKTLSSSSTSYGSAYVYDVEAPEVTHTLETDIGLDDTEASALEALALARDGVATVTDNAGRTYTGRVVALNLERAKGSALYQASITLRPTDDEEVSPPWTPPFSY